MAPLTTREQLADAATRRAGGAAPAAPAHASDPSGDWTPIAVRMPPEGEVVDTLTSAGRRQLVTWEGRLWRLPGGAHYPCFSPDYWRPGPPPRRSGDRAFCPVGREGSRARFSG
jgi:hypothetical protein